MASRTVLAVLTLLCAALTQAQLKGFELSGENWTYTQGDTKLTGVSFLNTLLSKIPPKGNRRSGLLRANGATRRSVS
jgi:hypothetical protein